MSVKRGPSSTTRAGLLMVALAIVFTYGLIHAFSIRFAVGDVYPPSSSMRASPDGTKLLFESLARTPGVTVSRNYVPIELSDDTGTTILVLGVNASMFAENATSYIDGIERMAKRGNRLVTALRWGNDAKPEHTDGLEKKWNVKLGFDKESKQVYFTEAAGWRVLESEPGKIGIIERDFDKGSVMLFAESRGFSNSAMIQMNGLGIVSKALGEYPRVVFDEQHFGIEESGSVAGLARRFRLTGMAIGLAICAALFIWKNGTSFPPPVERTRSETLSGRTSISGLNTLLHRHIKPENLARTCWEEWLAGNRREVTPERVVRAEAILRDHGKRPLDAAREIQEVLYRKGPL